MILQFQTLYMDRSPGFNEDSILFPENIYGGDGPDDLFGVFDGGTGLDEDKSYLKRTGGKTGGQIASETVKRVFIDDDKFLSGRCKPLEFRAREANWEIQKKMESYGIDTSKRISRWTVTGAAIRIDEDFIECFQIGDSVILAEYIDGRCGPVAGYFDQDIDLMDKWKEHSEHYMSQGLELKEIPKKVFEDLEQDFINNRIRVFDEIGNLNGEIESLSGVITGVIPTKGLKSIIITTDGLVLPKKDPKAPNDWNKMFSIYDTDLLSGVFEYVRDMEKSDIGQVLYPRLKMHDDVAAIALRFQ